MVWKLTLTMSATKGLASLLEKKKICLFYVWFLLVAYTKDWLDILNVQIICAGNVVEFYDSEKGQGVDFFPIYQKWSYFSKHFLPQNYETNSWI